MDFKGFASRVSGFEFTRPDNRNLSRRAAAARLILIAPLLFLLFFAAPLIAQEKIRIAPSSPGLATWPIHVASKEGFFAREGLSAEIIVMRTNTGIAALVTGSIDFTTAGGSAMRAAVNGAPLKMVLNITKKPDLWILAQKSIQRARTCGAK
jgi:ABC-type nitrate/sulfonate/bicarbonate transport system substrate-binding protein